MMLYGLAWYLLPLACLFIYFDLILPIATIAVLAFLLGWVLGGIISDKYVMVDRLIVSPRAYIAIGIVVAMLTVSLQVRPLQGLSENSEIQNYRYYVFEEPQFLFGSTILFTLYNSFLFPMSLAGIPMVMSLPKVKYKKQLFIAFVMLLLIDAVIKFGRFQILFAIFFLIYFNKKLNFTRWKAIAVIAVSIVAMQYLLFSRQYSGYTDFYTVLFSWETVFQSAISYNLIGYFVFNEFASNPPIDINPLNFNFLSGYSYYFEVLLGRFDAYIWYPWKTVNLYLTQGIYVSQLGIDVNAFGTNLMPLYFDFWFFGPFMLGIYLGFLSLINAKGVISEALACISMFIMIFGIYQPIVVSPISLFISLPILLGFVVFRPR